MTGDSKGLAESIEKNWWRMVNMSFICKEAKAKDH